MPCFVLGCGEPMVEGERKHPRFGKVRVCEGHGLGLMAVTAAYAAVRESTVVIRCVECGKRPCVCQVREAR